MRRMILSTGRLNEFDENEWEGSNSNIVVDGCLYFIIIMNFLKFSSVLNG